MHRLIEALAITVIIAGISATVLPLYINTLQQYEALCFEYCEDSVNTVKLCNQILNLTE